MVVVVRVAVVLLVFAFTEAIGVWMLLGHTVNTRTSHLLLLLSILTIQQFVRSF